jgi:hypothetical protein
MNEEDDFENGASKCIFCAYGSVANGAQQAPARRKMSRSRRRHMSWK